MQKYKIVASKSQKKYTIIVSADSEIQAKEKLHKEEYSILSISKLQKKDIEGQKFIFQVELNGSIKNGIIVGKDIFKVYVKLKDDLGYHVLFLYPEGDEAHTNAEKKQQIMLQLEHGYKLQKNKVKIKQEKDTNQEDFYLKKQLDSAHTLIEKVIIKLESLFSEKEKYNIDDTTFSKLENIYEKLIHIKGSTNLFKLKEIGELTLVKIAKIELSHIEKEKTSQSRNLLKDTNDLLKQLGSDKNFIEANKDIKKIIREFILSVFNVFSLKKINEKKKNEKKQKKLIDIHSYSYLKTTLLLEKYNEKLIYNSKEIRKNIVLFLNPFNHSEGKEKMYLKRKVIKQNISILKAKKTGSLKSYTGIKKGYGKIREQFYSLLFFTKNSLFIYILFYSALFLISLLNTGIFWNKIEFQGQFFSGFILIFIAFLLLNFSKNIILFFINIVFFSFVFIFSTVNF